MKKKHILPIECPDFTCHNYLTWSNAIVKANAKRQAKTLLSSRYINCLYDETSTNHKFVINVYDHWCVNQKFMQYQTMELLKETYQKAKIDFVTLLKKCLLNHSYVFSCCTWQYIEKDIEDPSLYLWYALVGYDDESQEFLLYGIDRDEQFSCFRVNYQTFADANFATSSLKIYLTLWRPNPDAKIALDIPNMILDLEDYIRSSNRRGNAPADAVYGFKAIDALCRHLCELSEEKLPLPHAYLQKFMMHKIYMQNRIEELAQAQKIDPIHLEQARQNADRGKQAFDLGNQYNEIKDQTLAKGIIDLMLDSVKAEADYLPKILLELKQ